MTLDNNDKDWIQKELKNLAKNMVGNIPAPSKSKPKTSSSSKSKASLKAAVDNDTATVAEYLEYLKLCVKDSVTDAIPRGVRESLDKASESLGKGVSAGAHNVASNKYNRNLANLFIYSNPLTALLADNMDILKGGWNITKGILGAAGHTAWAGVEGINALRKKFSNKKGNTPGTALTTTNNDSEDENTFSQFIQMKDNISRITTQQTIINNSTNQIYTEAVAIRGNSTNYIASNNTTTENAELLSANPLNRPLLSGPTQGIIDLQKGVNGVYSMGENSYKSTPQGKHNEVVSTGIKGIQKASDRLNEIMDRIDLGRKFLTGLVIGGVAALGMYATNFLGIKDKLQENFPKIATALDAVLTIGKTILDSVVNIYNFVTGNAQKSISEREGQLSEMMFSGVKKQLDPNSTMTSVAGRGTEGSNDVVKLRNLLNQLKADNKIGDNLTHSFGGAKGYTVDMKNAYRQYSNTGQYTRLAFPIPVQVYDVYADIDHPELGVTLIIFRYDKSGKALDQSGTHIAVTGVVELKVAKRVKIPAETTICLLGKNGYIFGDLDAFMQGQDFDQYVNSGANLFSEVWDSNNQDLYNQEGYMDNVQKTINDFNNRIGYKGKQTEVITRAINGVLPKESEIKGNEYTGPTYSYEGSSKGITRASSNANQINKPEQSTNNQNGGNTAVIINQQPAQQGGTNPANTWKVAQADIIPATSETLGLTNIG